MFDDPTLRHIHFMRCAPQIVQSLIRGNPKLKVGDIPMEAIERHHKSILGSLFYSLQEPGVTFPLRGNDA